MKTSLFPLLATFLAATATARAIAPKSIEARCGDSVHHKEDSLFTRCNSVHHKEDSLFTKARRSLPGLFGRDATVTEREAQDDIEDIAVPLPDRRRAVTKHEAQDDDLGDDIIVTLPDRSRVATKRAAPSSAEDGEDDGGPGHVLP